MSGIYAANTSVSVERTRAEIESTLARRGLAAEGLREEMACIKRMGCINESADYAALCNCGSCAARDALAAFDAATAPAEGGKK